MTDKTTAEDIVALDINDVPEGLRKLVSEIKRYNRRITEYRSGIEKLNKLIERDPGSNRVEGLKARIAEYQQGADDLPIIRGKAMIDLRNKLKNYRPA